MLKENVESSKSKLVRVGGGAADYRLRSGPQLLKVLNSVPYYVIIVNSDHEILLANRNVKERFREDPDDLIGGYCPKVIHGADQPIEKCPLEEAIQKSGPATTEVYDEETDRFFNSVIYPIQEDLFFHFVQDITEKKKAQQRLEETTIEIMEALSQTVEAKDEYTGDHLDRVQKYSLRLGKKFGLSDSRLEQLSYAAELHDIGKVKVPDRILGKEDSLNHKEWEQMKRHPEIGEKIVGTISRLERAAQIIGEHQEKYDGSGYPKGLQGEEITLEARIIAVVDAWDAMQTDRPYRDALSEEKAIQELKENAGTQFDPKVVEKFLEIKGELR